MSRSVGELFNLLPNAGPPRSDGTVRSGEVVPGEPATDRLGKNNYADLEVGGPTSGPIDVLAGGPDQRYGEPRRHAVIPSDHQDLGGRLASFGIPCAPGASQHSEILHGAATRPDTLHRGMADDPHPGRRRSWCDRADDVPLRDDVPVRVVCRVVRHAGRYA